MKIVLIALLLFMPLLEACPSKPKDFVWNEDPPTVINVGQQIQLKYEVRTSINWRVVRIAPGGGPDVVNVFVEDTGRMTGVQAGGPREVYAITNEGKVLTRFQITVN